jgi:hypothetical protein
MAIDRGTEPEAEDEVDKGADAKTEAVDTADPQVDTGTEAVDRVDTGVAVHTVTLAAGTTIGVAGATVWDASDSCKQTPTEH